MKLLLLVATVVGAFADDAKPKQRVTKFEIVSYNKDYMKDVDVTIFDISNGSQAVNSSVTFLKDLSMDLTVDLDFFLMIDGEKMPMFDFKNQSICKALDEDRAGKNYVGKYGGKINKCPVKAGPYIRYNDVMEAEQEPNEGPPPKGEYLMDFVIRDGDIELSKLHIETVIA